MAVYPLYFLQEGVYLNKQTNIPACNSGSNWWPRSWARARAWHTFTLCTNYLLHREQPGHILGRVRLWNFYETIGCTILSCILFFASFWWINGFLAASTQENQVGFFTGSFSNFLHKYPWFVQSGKLLVMFIFSNRSFWFPIYITI